MQEILGALAGFVVWVVAATVYVGERRHGVRSLRRLVAFWMGMPFTFFAMVFVRERSEPLFVAPLDDEASLFEEVRRDRTLRDGRDPSADQPENGVEA